ncbi:class GN sortase [Marinobacter salicampi]|uniref:class GN sortase n=1 Tax=Marinobacter salicampi TaxID=435907 RepID=UPI00140ABCB9|nr:class GN sortase [Marinobacter salicampi]
MSRCLLTLSLLFGAVFVVGAWIPLKAMLAQELLTLAWAETQARQQPARPWPWADTWPVARLDLGPGTEPLIVLEGVHGESLAFGPGRLAGATREGPIIIAGHRDTHFDALEHLKAGNLLRLQDQAGSWTDYEVTRIRIADSREEGIELDAMAPDSLLLVTCFPFDSLASDGPLRYLVEARVRPPLPLNLASGGGIADAGF